MKLCGVCIITGDVPRLAEFYKAVLRENPTGDDIHVSFEESQLSLWNPGSGGADKGMRGSVSLMYFVDSAETEYKRLKKSNLFIEFLTEPTVKPWGVKSFCFKDPEGNEINFLEPLRGGVFYVDSAISSERKKHGSF